jgi:predicted transcriptional regulator
VLYGVETTANLQEKVRQISREVEKLKSTLGSQKEDAKSNIDGLDRDLNEIHEEIRRIYKAGKR